MAKRPRKAAAAGGDDGGAAKIENRNTKLVPAKVLKSLLKSSRSLKESTDDLTLAYASEVKQAQDKQGLHKGAYATITKLDRMTPEKLADWKEHFDHMWSAAGLEDRVNSAPKLPMGTKEDEGDDDGETKKKGSGNVAQFPAAAGPAH